MQMTKLHSSKTQLEKERAMFVRFENFPVARPLVQDVFTLEQEVGSLFDGLISGLTSGTRRAGFGYAPAVDVAEYPAETVVVAELPGIRKEDVKIGFEKGVLTISGERKAAAVPEGSTWHRNEIASGTFSRAIELSHEVSADAIAAEMTNGILKIVVPKAEKARAREIAVR
jgi:HSP20 family protein